MYLDTGHRREWVRTLAEADHPGISKQTKAWGSEARYVPLMLVER